MKPKVDTTPEEWDGLLKLISGDGQVGSADVALRERLQRELDRVAMPDRPREETFAERMRRKRAG